jgi:glutamate formiminotransferase
VTLVGARAPLIAFNALLNTPDSVVARELASAVRESSGGLMAVRALGLFLPSRGQAQVSMNLLDYRLTPPATAAARIEEEAQRHGLRVVEYELVGCAPADLFASWPVTLAPVAGLTPAQLLESRLFGRS